MEKVGSAGSRFQTAPKNVEERFQQLDKFGTSIAPPCLFLLFSLSFSIPLSLSLWHFSFSASCLSIMFFSCWKSSHTTVTPNSGSKDALWCSPSATIWPPGDWRLSFFMGNPYRPSQFIPIYITNMIRLTKLPWNENPWHSSYVFKVPKTQVWYSFVSLIQNDHMSNVCWSNTTWLSTTF